MQPFDSSAYRIELLDARAHLEPFATETAIRGDGAAQFVYARSNRGSIELSKTQHLEIFVEFWSADAETPVREVTYPDFASALAESSSWLRGT